AVATGELRKLGLLIRKGHVLETLAVVERVIFDKTGTLTQGRMRLGAVVPAAGIDGEEVLVRGAALERGAAHPIAHAFAAVTGQLPPVEQQQVVVGPGVSGIIAGEPHVLGKPELLARLAGGPVAEPPPGGRQWLALGNARGLLGWIEVKDELRPRAGQALAELTALGLQVELLSGDRPAAAATVATALGMAEWRGGAAPEDKLQRVQQLQAGGQRVLMVGDGINDVPVLSGADVSVAMGDAVDVTRLHADSLLVSGDLEALPA